MKHGLEGSRFAVADQLRPSDTCEEGGDAMRGGPSAPRVMGECVYCTSSTYMHAGLRDKDPISSPTAAPTDCTGGDESVLVLGLVV
jgi:hypothetical protein